MSRYLTACEGDSRKAMTLYRLNLRLSQELFTVVSCFEIALRNAINEHYLGIHGQNWLRDAVQNGGFFDNSPCRTTADVILECHRKLGRAYTHPKLVSCQASNNVQSGVSFAGSLRCKKTYVAMAMRVFCALTSHKIYYRLTRHLRLDTTLVAELGFGFWRFMFAVHQFRAAGQTLLRIFPNKPRSTAQQQYNSGYVFAQLKQINDLRNRLAHHEPVCFQIRRPVIDTIFAKEHYLLIIQLFNWLNIDEKQLLYGLDHVDSIIDRIDNHL